MRKNYGAKPYLFPQPVLILATYDQDGNPNAMNAAWGGQADFDKILIDLSHHKTTDNMLATGAFTVGIGDAKQVVACDYVGLVSGDKQPDKLAKAGWTTTKSEFVNAPIINELPISLECKLLQVLPDGMHLGQVVNVSCDERYLGEDGLPDLGKCQPIVFDPFHHTYLNLGEVVGKAFADGKQLK